MKLLVCDVEGTLFMPHIAKDSEHPSYIWSALATHLGPCAVLEENETHRKWKSGFYGDPTNGESYMAWVKDTINIHKRHGLTKQGFDQVIRSAQYYTGCQEFFQKLNRNEYIPILISGGIKQFSSRACEELNIDEANSYTSCSYFFYNGKLDTDLALVNTSNFFGKHDLVKVALRKYGLGEKDWIFIGDGPNDVSVAKEAPVSIGISPLPELKAVVDYAFCDFSDLMKCNELIDRNNLLLHTPCSTSQREVEQTLSAKELTKRKVNAQIENLSLDNLQNQARERLIHLCGEDDRRLSGLAGIFQLLRAGEEILYYYEQVLHEKKIVSAALQPFSCAAEVMVNISDILFSDENSIVQEREKYIPIKDKLDRFKQKDLSAVISEYLKMRNISAHNYKRIPLEAAHALAQRTYEIIQRLELICTSVGTNTADNS